MIVGVTLQDAHAGETKVRSCRRPDPRGLRELRQKLFVALAGVTSDDAPQCGVSFERRRIDPEGLSLHQTGSAQALRHPCKHRPMGFEIDQSTRSGDRRVIGRRASQAEREKITQCQRVRRTSSNASLRVDAVEVAINNSRE